MVAIKSNYTSVQQSIAELKKNQMDDISSIVMYVLNPQLTSFNYDIYDFKKTNVDFTTGNIKIEVQDGIKMLFSLEDMISDGSIYSEDDYKIYVHFSFDDLTYDLYFKVLDNWEKVEHVDFKVPEDSKDREIALKRESERFTRFAKYVSSGVIINEHKKKGEKYFTEAVLDRYLENQEFDNEFIRTALMNEFKNPSAELITMLASALGKEFTTMEQEKVQERLQPLVKKGLYSAVESLVNGSPNKTTNSSFSQADYSYLTAKKEEPVTKKETSEVKPEPTPEPKKEEPKKEEVKVEAKEEPKKEETKKSGDDALRDLGINLNKKPVENKRVDAETLSAPNGSVSLDDLF